MTVQLAFNLFAAISLVSLAWQVRALKRRIEACIDLSGYASRMVLTQFQDKIKEGEGSRPERPRGSP